MAITHEAFWHYKQSRLTESPSIDHATDTLKVALMANTYTPDLSADEFWSDISADEIASGSGYTTGGMALASKAVGIDASGFAYLAADNQSWPSFTHSGIRYAVLYKDTGTPATSPLMTLIDFGADEALSGGTFSLIYQVAASGGLIEIP